MNIEKLTDIAIQTPGARASTGKFRLAGRTLWHKYTISARDASDGNAKSGYLPCLSHFNNFIVNWNCGGWEIGMAPRTANQYSHMHQGIKSKWLEGLGHGLPHGSYDIPTEDIPTHPAVEVRGSHRRAITKLMVTKPNELSTKLLLLGKHPDDDNELTRRDWLNYMDDAALEAHSPEFTAFPALESATQALAFGAITKENSMKTMASVMGHMKTDMDYQANSMVEEMEKQVAAYFAPPSKDAGTATSHIRHLNVEMGKLQEMASNISSACDTLQAIGQCPDSIVARIDCPSDGQWDCYAKNKTHDLKVGGSSNIGSTTNKVAEANGDPYHSRLDIEMGDSLVLKDWHSRSFSYYWMRRHINHYTNVLAHLGVRVPLLFGQNPEEWDYTTLAAPVFLASQEQ